jgi:superfamily I DNA and RNA helicase
LDLPLEGQHLIVGGPGTGKSVVALLRARRLAREKKDYLFLVYNVLLDKNSYGLGGEELKAVTWKRWFRKAFPAWFGRAMPEDADGDEDWDAIPAMEPLEDIDTSLYLVVDEGQDMPPQFYEVLIRIGFEQFYVAADQNQLLRKH